MAYIKDEVINEIRSQANIVDVISDYLNVTQRGKNFFAVCPFHDDHSPSLVISPERQIFNCFTCRTGGNVFSFVMKYENVSFIEAVSIVAKKIGYDLKIDTSNLTTSFTSTDDFKIMEFAKKYYLNNIFTDAGGSAREYLTKRGITENIIKEFSIGLAPKDKDTLYRLLSKKGYSLDKIESLGLINKSGLEIFDTFNNRIMIPIENMQGQVVGFTGRIFNGEDAAKYMNTRETAIFKKSEILFNYHNARGHIRDSKSIIIVEGNMDAIKMSASGIKNVVALQGVALSSTQISTLKKLRVPIILMLDNDAAGLDATLKNGDLLVNGGIDDIQVVRLTGAKDPDEYIEKNGVDALRDNINHALKYIDFKLEYLKTGKNLDNLEDLVNYVKDVIASLNGQDDLTKSLIISKISKDYQIDADILRKNIDVKNETVKNTEKVKTLPKKLDKYHKAASRIIYYMLNDSKYITIYQNRLGYFKEKIERIVASEIVYYNNLHGDINIADFTTYIMTQEDAYQYIEEIIGENNGTELVEDEFNSCIEVILGILKKDEIENLKNQIKTEMDINKKVALIERLTEIKKEV